MYVWLPSRARTTHVYTQRLCNGHRSVLEVEIEARVERARQGLFAYGWRRDQRGAPDCTCMQTEAAQQVLAQVLHLVVLVQHADVLGQLGIAVSALGQSAERPTGTRTLWTARQSAPRPRPAQPAASPRPRGGPVTHHTRLDDARTYSGGLGWRQGRAPSRAWACWRAGGARSWRGEGRHRRAETAEQHTVIAASHQGTTSLWSRRAGVTRAVAGVAWGPLGLPVGSATLALSS